MTKNEIYEQWKQSRKESHITEDFSSQVMASVYTYENLKKSSWVSRILIQLDFLPNNISRIAFIFGLSILGVFRISTITLSILIP